LPPRHRVKRSRQWCRRAAYPEPVHEAEAIIEGIQAIAAQPNKAAKSQ
jgi:hypothetical protein